VSDSPDALRARVEAFIREHDLIPPGGEVTCLVSGGQDSTCLWHALGRLGYATRAAHVAHGLRGAESDRDAAFCRDVLGAEVLDGSAPVGASEAELRDIRYELTAGYGLRATGHTASDDVETVLFRLVARAELARIEPRRADGVVRPLLPLRRDETAAYCRAEGLEYCVDTSNAGTARGVLRDQVLPLLRALHPAAERNLLVAATARGRLPRRVEDALLQLLASREGSQRIDLGAGHQAVREYDHVWLERGPVTLDRPVRWGRWTITAHEPGLSVRGWRAGDRLSGRSKKVQDVFVDAKVPRSEREGWPLVVRGDEVVAVPGIVDAPGVTAVLDD
jgi:tRNA(Ile)-lysidine synthase